MNFEKNRESWLTNYLSVSVKVIKLNPRSDRLDNGKAYSHSLQKRDSQTWFPHQEIGIVERSDS